MLRAMSALRTRTLSGHLQQRASRLASYSTASSDNHGRAGKPATKAVIFDMGGVLMPSPGPLFLELEDRMKLEPGTIIQAVSFNDQSGAWARMEKGEITWPEFNRLFSAECSRVAGKPVDMTPLMEALTDPNVIGNGSLIFPEMIDAVQCIRAEGIKTALLTNNWLEPSGRSYIPVDTSLFDVVVESCKMQIRKPDPRIFTHTLDQLNVQPQDAVFVDDIGSNLKAAKAMGIRTIKFNSTSQAVADLEGELGFPVQGFAPGTTSVPERLRIPVDKLKHYFNTALNLHALEDPVVRCYAHGQSNPTYFIRYANKDMVLRKKPPGKLLPSAHAVEREYRVMKAVRNHGVPVPKMLGLCEEDSLLGTPFYVMEHVRGRIFMDPMLPGLAPDERRQIYADMCRVLAKIHQVDIDKAQLQDFGKRGGYMKRNFQRWSRQYEASKTRELPLMDKLMKWLAERMPADEMCTLTHGDYRLDNIIFHPTKPEVVAVLDWELSTLGDPLSDLASNCMGYYLPEHFSSMALPGLFGIMTASEVIQSNIPSDDVYIAEYCRHMNLGEIANWGFYKAYLFFRLSAILQGVFKRFIIAFKPLRGNLSQMGIPTADECFSLYSHSCGRETVPTVDFHTVYGFFRGAAILQGVYKRYTQGLVQRMLPASKIQELGILAVDAYTADYCSHRGLLNKLNGGRWPFYLAYVYFRASAILQGVYKRFLQGQASSPTAEGAGAVAEAFAEIGWQIASESNIPPNGPTLQHTSGHSTATPSGGSRRNYSTHPTSSEKMSQNNYSTSSGREIPGSLPLSVSALPPRVQDYHRRVTSFIQEHVLPLELEIHQHAEDPKTKWTVHPRIEELKAKAKAEGLWNLFLPVENDPGSLYGAGLTNTEYAYICEEMGKSPYAPEVFNCSAPDTGNMEVLARYGSEQQKEQWLKPLLEGKIRSCFGMTEPAVASSDATNIQSSIRREGDSYIINGHKWWTSGAMDPRTKVCIFMGKTDTGAAVHKQQSMILVPMDAPGVKILRALTVFGYDDAPHGHAEIIFEDVKVPASNIILGEGRGFEIAQGRLGPGRIHHCMRMIGSAERALQLMVDRVQNRVAFGKPLVTYTNIQQDIAKSRIEIEQCRLLVLKSAYLMDTLGNKVAAPEIAMIKVAAPNMASRVIDRAIQAHGGAGVSSDFMLAKLFRRSRTVRIADGPDEAFGGMGVSQDTPLAPFFVWARVIRLADGPDEVHLRAVSKMEVRTQNMAKL